MFQPAAVATTYGHFLNAAVGSCLSQPTATSPLVCAPGPDQLSSQNNVIGIYVTTNTTVVGSYSEKVLQVAMHDQTTSDKLLVRDQARILPLGKM
jgi:predicted transporter